MSGTILNGKWHDVQWALNSSAQERVELESQELKIWWCRLNQNKFMERTNITIFARKFQKFQNCPEKPIQKALCQDLSSGPQRLRMALKHLKQ